MKKLQDDFRRRLISLDFCDVVYSVFPIEEFNHPRGAHEYRIRRTYDALSKYPRLSTCENKTRFIEAMIRLLSKNKRALQPGFLQHLCAGVFCVGPYEEPTEATEHQRHALMAQYQIVSETSIGIRIDDDNFVGYFEIFSQLSQSDLFARLEQQGAKNLFELTHYYFSRHYATLINPYVHNGKIKEKSLQVVELAARGMSNEHIASETYMTKRGVDYHLERMKDLLNANNRIELVRIAKDKCLL